MPKPQRRRRFSATAEREPQIYRPEARRDFSESEDAGPVPPPPAPDEERDAPAEAEPASETVTGEPTGEVAGETGEELPFRALPPRGRRLTKQRFSLLLVLLVSCLCLALGGVVGSLLPRPVPPAPVGERPEGTTDHLKLLTQTDEEALDAAYAARHALRFAEANQRFAALGQAHPAWGKLALETGRTQLYEGDLSHAVVSLKTAMERGWRASEAHCLLGVTCQAQKAYPQAELSFASAVALDPTQPDYYFLWGECLRAQGKPLEAISKFRSALLRNQYETANGLYQAKVWLTGIETNQEAADGTNAAIDEALQQTRPPMEALVAAAARDLKAGNSQAASRHLLSARDRSDAAVFAFLLGDPIFAPLRGQPEFASPRRAAPAASSPQGGKEPEGVPAPPGPAKEGATGPANPP